MNKTVSININGTVFVIEEDAYAELDRYINSIKRQFGGFEDQDDIVADIEARIGENLSELLSKEREVLTIEDVENVKEKMGTAKDYSTDDGDIEEEAETEGKPSRKRLYRDSDDQVIAGVCAGLGAYFGIDVLLIRIIFVLLTITGVVSVLMIVIYVLLWISVPEAKTVSEKMEMHGEKVTLSGIEDTIRDTLDKKDVKKKIEKGAATGASAFKRGAEHLFGAIRSVFMGLGKALKPLTHGLSSIVGVVLLIASVLSLIATTALFAIIAFNPNSPLIDLPLHTLGQGLSYYVLVGCLLLVVIIPLVFIGVLGWAAIRWRKSFNGVTLLGLLALWVVAIAVSSAIGFSVAPDVQDAILLEIEENKKGAVERVVDVEDFSGVDLRSNVHFTITQGDDYSVVLRGDEGDIENMDIEINEGVLVARRDAGFELCIFCFHHAIYADIVVPDLERLYLSGATDGEMSGFELDELTIYMSGASELEMESDVDSLSMWLSGASGAVLIGEGENLTADLSGSSDLKARGYVVQNAEIEASGASDAAIGVEESLSVDLSGSSGVVYYGDPELEQELSGASDVRGVDL